MNASARAIALAGAMLALSAVILAAMGSHLFDITGLQGTWQIASNIHLFNSAALLGLAALLVKPGPPSLRWGAWLIVVGTVIFCGSIYLHIITGRMMSGVTPSGGLLMMMGWLLVIVAFLRKL
ncbi:MAG: DUF423 domain-containing protein [Xanthomonadales bacterium]|nr:DUF423 domain-containing protein [Xanthomonadales bacterium]